MRADNILQPVTGCKNAKLKYSNAGSKEKTSFLSFKFSVYVYRTNAAIQVPFR